MTVRISRFSLIEGFAVPFMVSTGAGNYIVLFTLHRYFKHWNLGIAFYKNGI